MKKTFWTRVKNDIKKNKTAYLMVLPVLLFYILFHYKPMYGTLIAFYRYKPAKGFSGSVFIGLDNFIRFFESPFFVRTLTNTVLISLYSLVIVFPAPIILALMLNEVRSTKFKKVVQTVTYLPHFISVMVICGMLTQFCLSTGLFNDIVEMLGGERVSLLQKPEYFRTIYILSDLWQTIGWSSILYLAALAGVDRQLYEAARVDGAGKWKQMIHVTLPGIAPTIIIQLILRVGRLLNVGYEKTLLLYGPATYSTADIISTYTYRMGLEQSDWGYSAAVGLFNSVINCLLLIITNKISKKCTETSLW